MSSRPVVTATTVLNAPKEFPCRSCGKILPNGTRIYLIEADRETRMRLEKLEHASAYDATNVTKGGDLFVCKECAYPEPKPEPVADTK